MKRVIFLKNCLPLICGLALLTVQSCKKDAYQATPAPEAGTSTVSRAVTKTGPLTVGYIEVNSNSILDVGKYTLASNGANVFDIGIIFAANINYNTTTQQAVLYFNPQVTTTLSNYTTTIQPLQNQGIKVLLSILGNHQGAGICNFPSQAAAQAFAQQLANAVTTYGLDGIDFDDEYADYGTNGTGQPNTSSFVYLVTALRSLMPTKIISFYDYGPAASELSYGGVTVGSKVNYSWNAIYGSWSVPNVPGLTKSQLGPAAIDIGSTGQSTANSLATQTVSNGYGVYLTYNLSDGDHSSYVSGFTNALYGSAAVYNGGSGGSTGAVFYKNTNYGGTATSAIPKGSYTLAQLQAYGFVDNWASSVKLPSGWKVIMYKNDSFGGTSWTLTSSNTNFTTLSPNANDVVTSVKIQ